MGWGKRDSLFGNGDGDGDGEVGYQGVIMCAFDGAFVRKKQSLVDGVLKCSCSVFFWNPGKLFLFVSTCFQIHVYNIFVRLLVYKGGRNEKNS